jgi:hypothetical protein
MKRIGLAVGARLGRSTQRPQLLVGFHWHLLAAPRRSQPYVCRTLPSRWRRCVSFNCPSRYPTNQLSDTSVATLRKYRGTLYTCAPLHAIFRARAVQQTWSPRHPYHGGRRTGTKCRINRIDIHRRTTARLVTPVTLLRPLSALVIRLLTGHLELAFHIHGPKQLSSYFST